jgi:hypothetical protein
VLKKIGITEGLADNVLVRNGKALSANNDHLLVRVFRDAVLATYAQTQIASANAQIDTALRVLFPRYYSLGCGNITWRMTKTVNENLHVDGFKNGQPLSAAEKQAHRVKIFVNIDTEPRHWSISATMPDLMKRCRAQFLDTLPDDADAVATFISRSGMLDDLPTHEIRFPTLSAVIGEAQVISHAVRYGNRMIAAEYGCLVSDMLDPSSSVHAQLPTWLAQNGIAIGPQSLTAEMARYNPPSRAA